MTKPHASLTFRIAFIAASIAVMATFLAGLGSYLLIRGQIRSSVEMAVTSDATDAANRVTHLLDETVRNLNELAENPLTSNALADIAGLDSYLVPNLRQMVGWNGLNSSLTLVDFSLRPLAHVGPQTIDPDSRRWLHDVIIEGKAASRIDQTQQGNWVVTLANPVQLPAPNYSGGALVMQIGLVELARAAGSGHQTGIDDYVTFGGQPTTWKLGDGEESIGVDTRLQQIPLRLQAPLNSLSMRILALPSPALVDEPLQRLTVMFLLCGVAVVLLAVIASAVFSGHIVRPLRKLSDAAAAFDLNSGASFPATDNRGVNDEITQLSAAIQTMAERLKEAYVRVDRRGRALLRNAESVAGVGSWRLAADGRSMLWTDKTSELLDLPAQTTPSLDALLNAIAFQDRKRLGLAIQALTGQGQPLDEECALRAVAGKPHRTLRLTARPAIEAGQDGAIDGTIQDISRLRQDADKLMAASARIEAILDNTPVGIAIFSQDRLALQSNKAFCQIFGLSQEQLIGQSAKVLYGDSGYYEDLGLRAYPRIMQGETFEDDVLMQHASGRPIWVRLEARMVKTDDPSLGIVWAADDITDRKEAGERLAAAHRQLEEQAHDLARSNGELEQFAYVASHDLRQPLRQVASYVTLLEREYSDKLDDDGRTFIAFARSGAERMDRLIVDLLEYSRIGRKSNPMTPLALADVLAEAAGNLSVELQERRGSIDIAPTDLVLQGERSELMRLFQNLISNALKYCPNDRPPHVRVGIEAKDGQALITVEDNGIGIKEEFFERIFGIFQRLHGRQEYEGTGIGLAVCKKIVDHHKGRIWLDSVVDQGTRFHVALPLGDAS